MEKPYLNNDIKLDEQALRKIFLYNLNKIYPVLLHLTYQLPCLADESCFGDLENALTELFMEVKLHVARINAIFDELKEVPKTEKSISVNKILEALLPDKGEYSFDNLSKDLHLVFHVQKILNIKRNYYSILKSIAGSLNNIDIKQHLQYNYDECESNQIMFKLIAKEYMDTSINTFLHEM
ncbi:MAG: DUF892 family protein [Sphingobacteriaceae bacterium]|nr:MAG: DUF892 family protein [Sphingobacteriaceae bacterium]